MLVLSASAKEKITPSYATAARVDCGGKQTLKASGSTAQANAMTRFVKAYEKACPGQTVAYTSNGSGAGVGEFLAGQTDFGGSDSPLVVAVVSSSGVMRRVLGMRCVGEVEAAEEGVRSSRV